MTSKKKAIVLGGTIPHKELISNLRERGYYIYLLDYDKNSLAKGLEDEYILESIFDKEKVLEVAKKLDVDLVISTCSGQANVTACYVAEKLGLPRPYSYETALNVTDKTLMKPKMSSGGIPTSKFLIFEDSINYEINNLNFPLVVKPADVYGSKGVRKVENSKELKLFIKKAFDISRSNKVIVEEFIDGKEINIYMYIQEGQPYLLLISEKIKIPFDDKNAVMQSPGTISPANLNLKLQEKFKLIGKKITNEFNLKNTSLLIQAIVNDNEVNVLEFAARGGGGLSFRTIKLITGFDIIDATVNSYLDETVNMSFKQATDYYGTNQIYAQPGKFGGLAGVEELYEKGLIEEFFQYKKRGMSISNNMSSSDRVGSFINKGNSKEEIVRKAKKAFEILEVYNDKGDSILKKNIRLK